MHRLEILGIVLSDGAKIVQIRNKKVQIGKIREMIDLMKMRSEERRVGKEWRSR
mgnify:CR=1 FL=1